MYSYHPKLVSIMTEQTPRAMIALMIVSLVYISIFFQFIPLNFLLLWLFFQLLLVVARLYNAKVLKIHIKDNNTIQIKQNVVYFIFLNVYQASMWTIASLLCIVYAPAQFEFVTFVMVTGIITAAVLSMSSIFSAYVIFFLFMIIPQMIIMVCYGDQQHIALVLFLLIYIPSILVLSKSIYSSHINAIKTNEALELNVSKLHKLSIIDSLTHVYNRRYFFEMAQNIISISERGDSIISLLMIDIDFFKKINDTYGHQAGDFILETLAANIKGLMRKSDIFARVGGEEFAVILHTNAPEGAKIVAEKIRKAIEKKDFIYDDTFIKLTLSIGVAVADESTPTIEALYKKADDQLYKAKETGRNRVC